jgi:hypothetical protein
VLGLLGVDSGTAVDAEFSRKGIVYALDFDAKC